MKSVFAIAATAAMVALSSCNPLSPRDLDRQGTSRVAVAFDPSALGPLAAQMKTLKVRVYKVENETRGTQEGADKDFAIVQQQAEYSLTGVKLGPKEFEVSILNADNLALGTGTIRHLVKPGVNVTGALIIKLNAVQQPITNLGIELALATPPDLDPGIAKRVIMKWKTQTGAEGELELKKPGAIPAGVLTLADVQPILEESCISCHKATNAKKKLQLDVFPFKSGFIADQSELLKEVLARIQDEDAPMPPGELMEASNIEKFKAWETGGFLAAAATGAADAFAGKLEGLKVADKLSCTIIVFGEGDSELFRKDLEPYTIIENGQLKLTLPLEIAAPSVSIPITVQPAG